MLLGLLVLLLLLLPLLHSFRLRISDRNFDRKLQLVLQLLILQLLVLLRSFLLLSALRRVLRGLLLLSLRPFATTAVTPSTPFAFGCRLSQMML